MDFDTAGDADVGRLPRIDPSIRIDLSPATVTWNPAYPDVAVGRLPVWRPEPKTPYRRRRTGPRGELLPSGRRVGYDHREGTVLSEGSQDASIRVVRSYSGD